MAARVLDPKKLIGDRLIGVAMGSPSEYLLLFDSGVEARPTVSDDGTLELVVGPAQNAAEAQAIDRREPFADLVGRAILGVDRVWWLGGGGVGLRLRVETGALVIAADQARGRYEIAILDGDVGEDWGREPIT